MKSGNKVKAPAKRQAFTALVGQGGYFIGLATEGEAGYAPQIGQFGIFHTYDEAKKAAASRNLQMFGYDPKGKDAYLIVLSSMAAQPRDFDPSVGAPGSFDSDPDGDFVREEAPLYGAATDKCRFCGVGIRKSEDCWENATGGSEEGTLSCEKNPDEALFEAKDEVAPHEPERRKACLHEGGLRTALRCIDTMGAVESIYLSFAQAVVAAADVRPGHVDYLSKADMRRRALRAFEDIKKVKAKGGR